MRNAGLEEAQAGIKIARRNINKLRYADDTTLMEESEEEIRKHSSAIDAQKQRKTIEWEGLEISSRKLEIPKEHFMQRRVQ